MRKKRKQKLTTERLLLPRLRYMGYTLLLFSLCFFIYALNTSSSPELTTILSLPEEELSAFAEIAPKDTLNFFAVSSLFASIGIVSLLTYRKKLKPLQKKK
ncbi:MAG: hypothetical protein V4489_00730 [Chlamydiota bacterium]